MKVKRKIRSLLVSLLCVMLLAGVLPTAALAEEQVPTDNPRYTTGVSRSKTATPLDTTTWTSDVTLSLPSAEEKLDSDVVFVLDGSSSADSGVVDASLSLLRDLKDAAENSGAAVNVCVVKFKRQAYKSDWFDLSTDYDAIKAAMGTKYSGGTNIHAGLLAGKKALEEHQNISPDKKYLVLVSDGSTYLYSKDGNWASDTPFSRTYYTKENYNGAAGGFWDNGLYEPNNYPEVNVPRPKTTSDVAAWRAYLADVEERNAESNGDQYDYHIDYDLNFNQGIPSDDFKSQPAVMRSANNRDMAFFYADQVWQQIKSAGYNAYSIATKDGSAGEGNADDSHCFMNYLNGGASLDFSTIRNEILYAVDAGSYVTDYMGYVENDYNFDLVNDPAKIYVTVGDETLEAVSLQENTYGFGKHENQNGVSYDYVLTYTPAADGEENFLWSINVPITNLRHVQLHYTVKLMNPKTEAGTYGTYDPSGSHGYDGLYTNNSATLYPMATGTGRVGDGQDFLKPTVSYQINYYTVTVNYVDEDGNILAPAYTSASLKEGSAYDVTAQAAPAIQGYTYKVTTGDALTGTLDGNKVITVVYTKDNYYTVTVNFVDEDGNTVAPAYTSDSMKEGSAYDVTAQAAPAIQGYTYKVTTGDPLTGTLDGNKVITVVYTKDSYYTVTVNFVDEDGNTVAPAYTSDSMKEGSTYDVTAQAAPAIQGYTYKATTGDALTGTLDGNKVITVVYTKDSYYTVIVNFVDENGNPVAPAYTSDSMKEGSAYDVTAQAAPAIQGYTYKVTTGDALTGTLDGNKVITVVYTKDNYYTVTVNFVDEDGNPVAPAYTSDSLKEGSAYDVIAQAAPAIQGYTYKVTTGDALTGTLDGNKVITVVYTKDTVDPINPDPVKPEPTKPADTPNTGDSSHMFLWLGLALVSGSAAMGAVIVSKKKNHNR